MSRTLKLTPTESVEVRTSSPELLEVVATYGPMGSPPPRHLHPAQDERFAVLEGAVTARVGSEERTLAPGDSIEIPRGTAHQMWNPGATAARVRWETRPAGRTEQWFAALDALQRSGRVRDDGMPGPLAFGVMLTEYRDVFRLAAGPEPLVRAGLALLAVLGRARGYAPVPA